LERELGADVTLVRGSGGIFDVTLDGRLAFSKRDTGRFPSNEELSQLGSDPGNGER